MRVVIISVLISIVGLIVGIVMALHVMTLANVDPMTLCVTVTVGSAILCAGLCNTKPPEIEKENP